MEEARDDRKRASSEIAVVCRPLGPCGEERSCKGKGGKRGREGAHKAWATLGMAFSFARMTILKARHLQRKSTLTFNSL